MQVKQELAKLHADRAGEERMQDALAQQLEAEKVMLEPLSKMIESTLDLIYDAQNLEDPVEKNVERYTAIISEMYDAVNSHSKYLLLNRGNFMIRSINLSLNMNAAWKGKQ